MTSSFVFEFDDFGIRLAGPISGGTSKVDGLRVGNSSGPTIGRRFDFRGENSGLKDEK
jgi:hypothetical protein